MNRRRFLKQSGLWMSTSLAFPAIAQSPFARPDRIGALMRRPIVSPGYSANAATFDGTTNYLNRGGDLTGNADGKIGTCNIWFKTADNSGADNAIIGTNNQAFEIYVISGEIRIDAYNSGGSIIMRISSSPNLYNDNVWHNLLASWDLSDSLKRWMYVDNSSVIDPIVYTNDVIDYTRSEWTVGSRGDSFGKFTGCLSEVWFDENYLDLSNSSNRAKFYNGGAPVSLGTDGSTPTGSQPILYMRLWDGTNSGSGGNFTVNGTLSGCTAP